MKESSTQSPPTANCKSHEKVDRYEVDDAHWYHLQKADGSTLWMPSVTRFTGLYPKGVAFHKWLASQGSFENAEKYKEERGELGSNVHAGIEELNQGRKLSMADFTPEERWHLMSYMNWYRDFRPEILAVEEIVYDAKRKIAGTLDIRCKIGGAPGIVDLKTCNSGIYREHCIQSNEYGYLANGNGKPAEWAGVLRTNTRHKVKYEFQHWKLCDKMHALFEALMLVGKDFDPKEEPKIYRFPSALELPR